MKRTIIVFVIISMFAKIIAYARELFLSYFWGAGKISDVFILSMTLPVTLFGFIAAGVASGYIPTYQKVKTEENEQSALRFTNNVINLLVVICLVMINVYFLIPKQLLGLFASGFDDDTLEIARKFTNLSIWATLLVAVVTVLSGYLQINDKINITALVSVPLNLGLVLTVVASAIVENIYILPLGFLLSSILQTVLLWGVCRKKGFKYSVHFDRDDKYLKFFLSNLTTLVFSSSLLQANVLVDRTLATQMIVGGLSIFEYGHKINDFVMGLTIIPISVAIFPIMIKESGDVQKLGKTLTDGIRLLSFLIIPISVVMMVFAEEVVRFVYFRGAFTMEDVIMTSEIVRFYGVGLLAFSFREIMVKCFYALGDVKSPMINSSIGIVCNIGLNFILLKVMGLGGLALATSISAVVSVVLLCKLLKKIIRNINIESIVIKSMELFVIATGICYGTMYIYRVLSEWMNGEIIPFFLSLAIFGILYAAIILFTGITNKGELMAFIKR